MHYYSIASESLWTLATVMTVDLMRCVLDRRYIVSHREKLQEMQISVPELGFALDHMI